MQIEIAIKHLDYQKTISFIAQNYYWPGLKKMIWCYMKNSHSCRRAIALKDQYNGLLKPLLISFHFWTNVTFDFVTSLLLNNGYNAILKVVNY